MKRAQKNKIGSRENGIKTTPKSDERKARFEAVVESFPNGLLGVDSHGRIELVNEELEKMFGYSRLELIGKPVEVLIPPRFRSEHVNLVKAYFLAPTAKILGGGRDLEGVRKDGSTFSVEVGLRPIVGGGTLRALAAISDITKRKKIESDLRRSNEELEHFAYVVSHDLQEPARMIASFAEMLRQDYGTAFDERGQRWLTHITDGATRMRALMNGLLSYCRVGTQELRWQSVNTDQVIKDVLDDLAMAIKESRAEVSVDKLPDVMGDQNLLRLLFQNLISNAIKFIPEGRQPLVKVEAWQDGRFFKFAVKDNGIGIEEEYFSRIFVIFQRLHGITKYPGTGLGLAICDKVVKRHLGRIWVESTPGTGSTFNFTLANKVKFE